MNDFSHGPDIVPADTGTALYLIPICAFSFGVSDGNSPYPRLALRHVDRGGQNE